MLTHKGLLSITGTEHQAERMSDQTHFERSATTIEKSWMKLGGEGKS